MDLCKDIASLLAYRVRTAPDATAFVEGDRVVTYAEFARLSGATAAWLSSQGVQANDRVAVWLVNRLEWLALYFGLSQLGATLITVNTRYRARELSYILERSAATMLVLEPSFRKIDFSAVLEKVDASPLKSLRQVVVIERDSDAEPRPILGRKTTAFRLDQIPAGTVAVAATPDSVNIVFTTSGTTSGPKLVAHSQYTIAVHSQHVARRFGMYEGGTRLLGALPFCGVFGLNGVLGAFAAGAPVVIMDTFDAAGAVRLTQHHRVTHIYGSDEMFSLMLNSTPEARPLPSARYLGFAAFHPGTERLYVEAQRRHVPLYGVYGSSEVQALFSGHDAETPLAERFQGGGSPCNPGAEIRVRDITTGKLLPAGESGSLEIRADTNFVGYLDNPDATTKVVGSDGFFKTGDLGHLSKHAGFIYETRLGDAIRLSGYLVSPVEIEDILEKQTGIKEAQVIGVELDGRNRCVAFVILQPGARLDEDAIKTALGITLAPYKVPAHIWPIDAFPATEGANGTKIQRSKLRDLALMKIKSGS